MLASRCVLPLAALLAFGSLAAAQTGPVRTEGGAERGYTTIRMAQSVTIPVGENDDPAAKQQEALKSFYSLVGGTCRTVLETIAETCEITSISFNFRSGAQAYRAENQRDHVRIDGEVNMVVGLKPEVGPPSPENSKRAAGQRAGRF